MAHVSAPNPRRKYAVQKPKGKKWETLALLDDLDHGRAEFRSAVAEHGAGFVRLIQIDFQSEDALSDYDWHLVELHDPNGGKGGRPKPTVIAGTERAASARRGDPQPRKGKQAAAGRAGNGAKPPPPPSRGAKGGGNDRVSVPYATWIGAALFGALAVAIWILWFRI